MTKEELDGLIERLRKFSLGLDRRWNLIDDCHTALTSLREQNERQAEALYAIIDLDHHNMGPESKATKIARAALTMEESNG